MFERIAKGLLLAVLWTICSAGFVAGTGDKPSGWPQWRGPNRDAVSLETGLALEWPAGGPHVLWRAEIGAGYSGVSVEDGKLYTLWDENAIQFLVCLDARTGKELWRRSLGAAFVHPYGNGPRSTPLVDEGVVFAVGTQGRLVAVDAANGENRWQHNLVKEHGSKLPSYGYASSPLVMNGRVFVEAGGQGAAFIAFDKKTGSVAWTSHEDVPAYSSPIAVSIDGVDQVVFWSASGLHSLEADDGNLLWEYSWETYCPVSGDPLNTATPIYIPPNRIFLSSGSGAAVLSISRTDKGFHIQTVWKSQEMRNDVNTSLLYDGHIYGFDGSLLKCIDAATGEVRWKARGFGKGSLIAAADRLIVLGEQGEVAIVEASPDAFVKRAGAAIMDGRNWTAPSLANGKLFLRNHEELVCLNMTTVEGRENKGGGGRR